MKLRFGGGTFQDGFTVSAGIGEDEYPYSYKTEIPGAFPPGPEIPACYDRWRSAWKVLDKCLRGSVGQTRAFNTADLKGECRKAADELRKCVSAWFGSGNRELQTFKDKLYPELGKTETVRVLIQTSDPHLRKLPWHEWDLFADIYTESEFALCGHEYDHAAEPEARDNCVRILAILGNDEGINVRDDRDLLKRLAGKNARFLSKPKPEEVSDHLWEEAWDILFFAGHSSSQSETGRMYVNETDSLTVERLRNGLRTAIKQGLQLAIFNSCDGLKLAEDLANLNIPQVIIMREPVPNRVAQAFLRYFLRVFSHGKSLYLSVREARERLHENFDDEYPGVGWVPAICQNPVAEPLCWDKPVELAPKTISVAITTDDRTRFEADVPSDTLVDQLLRAFLYYWQPSPVKKEPKKYLLCSDQPGSPAFDLSHTLRQAGISDQATISLVSEPLEPDSAVGLYIEDAGKQQFITAVSLNTRITRLAEAFLQDPSAMGNMIVELVVGGTPESETVRPLDLDATLFDEGVHDYAVLRIYRDVNQRRR